jgi:Fibronectin type III domain
MGLRSCGMRCRRLVASRYAAINHHFSSLFHIGFGALLALTLTACGGGGGGSDAVTADTQKTAQDAAPSEVAQAVSTQTWTSCASENQTCSVPGTQLVRYGVDGAYFYKTVSGSIACNNAQWGDPAFLQVKHCDYAAAASSGSWSFIADENQPFSLASAQTVRYGQGSVWVERTVSGSGNCSNWFFGADPVPGVAKRCEVQGAAASAPAPAPAASGWSFLANEGQSISLAASSTVRYGLGSAWVQRTVSGGGTCSNWFFGSDPAPNQVKHCEVLGTTASSTSPAPAPAPAPVPAAGTASLQWNATASGNVVGYRVYWGTAPGSYQQAKGSGIGAGNTTSYTVQNLPAGSTYYFAVTAYDASGAESAYSTEASKTIQ